MSLFGSLMPGFDDDPFFGGPRSIMRQMDRMMSSMLRDPFQDDPFFSRGGVHEMGFPALTAGPLAEGPLAAGPLAAGPLAAGALTAGPLAAGALTAGPLAAGPLSAGARARRGPVVRDPFASIMSSMDQMAGQANCHTFSSSSVMTMTTGPDGRPQVYQATSSSRAVPGGVRETRRSVADSRTGTRKMAIGHHIGERSHIIEREHTAEGDLEEKQEFINLEEEEAPQFDHEFRRRTQHVHGGNSLEYRPRHRRENSSYNRVAGVPAITSSSHEDRARRRDREERGQRSGRR